MYSISPVAFLFRIAVDLVHACLLFRSPPPAFTQGGKAHVRGQVRPSEKIVDIIFSLYTYKKEMRVSFLSDLPCAFFVNGIHLGPVDGFERCVELAPHDGVFCEFKAARCVPVRFRFDEAFLFEGGARGDRTLLLRRRGDRSPAQLRPCRSHAAHPLETAGRRKHPHALSAGAPPAALRTRRDKDRPAPALRL